MTWAQRLGLMVGTHYRCRCRAVIHKTHRERHERFHEAWAEFFQPPSAAEIAEALREPSAPPR